MSRNVLARNGMSSAAAALILCFSQVVQYAFASPPSGTVDNRTAAPLNLPAPTDAMPAPPPIPPPSVKTLDQEQITAITEQINKAKTPGTMIHIQQQIADAHYNCSLPSPVAYDLMAKILKRKQILFGSESLDIAMTEKQMADYLESGKEAQAIPIYKESLNMARTYAGPQSNQALAVQGNLVRALIFSHAKRSQIAAYCPACPQCHSSKAVVPIYGMLPITPDQVDGGYAVRGCQDTSPQEWYCRKCRGEFFPYKKVDANQLL